MRSTIIEKPLSFHPSMSLIVVLLTLLVLVAVLAVAMADQPPSRTASANCSSCHTGSFYMRVTVTSVTAPVSIEVGSTGTVDVQVEVSCSHKSSNYATFAITVSLAQQNARLTLPQSQSLTGQVPGGSSAPYTWSRTFSFTVTGKAEGDEVITASARMDPNHEASAVTDSSTAPTTVTLSEHPPVLSLPSIEPTTGDTKTDFTYKVKYSDADGDAPSFVDLFVDGSLKSALSPLPGQGSDHRAGVVYGISGINLAQGSHTYGFTASDGTLEVELPVGGYLDGPEVRRSDSSPVLSNGTVSPASGRPGDIFKFTVDYMDPDDDPPDPSVLVSFSGGPFTAMSLDPSAPSSKRDGRYLNGESYYLERALSEGTYEFVLNASDGTSFSELGPIFGPVVSSAPVLIGKIDAPVEGSEHMEGEPIWFNGTYASNKAPTDTVMTWRSNISGQIGTGPSVRASLNKGDHEVVLNVSSASLGLFSESKVRIEVLSEVPVITVLSFSPSSQVVLYETEEVFFKVKASVDPTVKLSYEWRFDGEIVAVSVPDHRLVTDHTSAGSYVLECEVSSGLALPVKVVWTISVVDVPAPIVHDGPTTIDLGLIERGDTLDLILNVSDPLGRALSVQWWIDGVEMDHLKGTETSLTFLDGEWSVPGEHTIKAIVQNPDGKELELLFNYFVSGPDPLGTEGLGPPDLLLSEGEEDGGLGKTGLGPLEEDWPGYLIVIVCSLVAGIKLIAAVIGLVRSEPPKVKVHMRNAPILLESRVDEEGFEIWG